jgi:hypothetical protein
VNKGKKKGRESSFNPNTVQLRRTTASLKDLVG